MESRQYASKFKVSSLTKELQFEADLRLELQRTGFQTTAYSTKSLDCHILVIDTVALEDSLSQVVERALTQNPDLRMILLCKQSQMRTLLEYKKYQADALLDSEDPFLKEKVLWEVEKSARFLYLFYQNEQLLKDYSDVQKQLDKSLQLASTIPVMLPPTGAPAKESPRSDSATATHDSSVGATRGDLAAATRENSVGAARESLAVSTDSFDVQSSTNLLRHLLRCESLDSVLKFFIENAPHERKIFFRYLPQENCFRATFSEGLDLSELPSLEHPISDSDLRELLESRFSEMPEGLEDLLVRAFQDPHFLIFPMIFQNHILGFAVMKNSRDDSDFQREREYLEVIGRAAITQAELYWSRTQLRNLEVKDSETPLYNEKFYSSRLRDEQYRAERMRYPLSLLVFEIDNFEGLRTLLGDNLFKQKLLRWCEVLHQTSRAHDISCRLGEKTFAIILPHCLRKDAVQRAERWMKTVSAHPEFRDSFQTVLSFGVSEYPSLCGSAEELDVTARRVMKKVQERGGNRVGVYRGSSSEAAASHRAEAE